MKKIKLLKKEKSENGTIVYIKIIDGSYSEDRKYFVPDGFDKILIPFVKEGSSICIDV